MHSGDCEEAHRGAGGCSWVKGLESAEADWWRDFRPKSIVNVADELYAATPPLELLKFLLCNAATSSRGRREPTGKNARNFTLCGLRTAASSWGKECTRTMEEAGFVTGVATTCSFSMN